MASIPSSHFSPPPSATVADQHPSKSAPKSLNFPRRRPNPLLCRRSDDAPSGDDSGLKRWDSWLHNALRGAAKRWEDYVASCRTSLSKIASMDHLMVVAGEGVVVGDEKVVEERDESGEWDWERWKRFFVEVEEMEGVVLALKSQLRDAIFREDYEDAAKLKLAIDAATKSDIVWDAILDLNRAIEEERYNDAIFIRDHRGAGLVGWWAGVSDDGADPYGRIVKISAEHGRYVAKSYSPRQLASGRPGFPLFEVYFALVDGEYKNQAVYLKHSDLSADYPKAFESRPIFGSLNSSGSLSKGEDTLQMREIKLDEEKDGGDNDGEDMADGLSKIQNVLRDIIPGVKVKVLKVVSPGKVDKDMIAKVIEQIVEEDGEGSDDELETTESEDIGTDDDTDGIADETGEATSIHEENGEVSVNVVISAVTPKVSGDPAPKNLARIPASLEKRGHSSFSLILEKDTKQEASRKAQASRKKMSAQDSTDLLMSDLAKVITSKDMVHIKVLKNIGELINYAVNQKQNFHSLSGATSFSRIQVPTVSDPLSGLYVGTHGIYSSNVLHLRRKFGHWKEDNLNLDLEFYEYVEAVKLTGDPSVPAGQVAFRAKVGKQNQLPHKGIIPEEFGVVARYRGQGKLAEPGYQNPRWVDGELVILDGKFIRGGPVIGFVYWAPESHFLLFFNRLMLPD